MSINTSTLVSNFEKLERDKYVEVKESDIEVVSIAPSKSKKVVSLYNEVLKRNDKVLEMLNAVNCLKLFKIDLRMFDILLHRMELSKLNVDFEKNRKGQFIGIQFWLYDKPINERFYMDGKNVYGATTCIDFSKGVTTTIHYPEENVMNTFLKDFDVIYDVFCDYLEALSNGDKFVEKYYDDWKYEKLWREEASTGNKIYYHDSKISNAPLRTTI